MNFQELMARMAELDKPVQEDEQSDKDYDGDGEIESNKDEVWGSRAKAAAKSGKPFKEDNMEENFEQGIEEIADEVDECGGIMSPMGNMSPKQSDNVSMNINMTGSGSGGIRDLMNILRNLEDDNDSMHHGNDDPIVKMLGKKEPMLGDASGGGFDDATTEPNTLVAPTHAAIPSGDDLHKSKDSFSNNPYRGDNPMAVEGIKNRLSSLYEEIKNQ